MASDSVTTISGATLTRSESPGVDLALFAVTIAAMSAVLVPVSVASLGDSLPLSLLTVLAPATVALEAAYLIKNRQQVRPEAIEKVLVLFAAWFLARNSISNQGLVAVKYIIYGPVLFVALSLLFENRRYRELLPLVITGAAAVTALYGIVEYIAQADILAPYTLDESARGVHRVGSTIVHPVAYGALLVQSIPFCVLTVIRSRGWLMHIFSISATVWTTIALVLTFSKGSWLTLGFMAIMMMAVLIARRDLKGLSAAGGLVLGTLSVGVVFYHQIVSEFLWRRQASFGVRLQMWEWTVSAIKEHFLLGVGLRNGAADLAEHGALEWYTVLSSTLPIDNFYLSLWLEAGLIGFFLFMMFLGLLLMEGVRCVTGGRDTAWSLALMASIAGILINSITFEALLNWPNLLFFWIAAAALHATARRDTNLA